MVIINLLQTSKAWQKGNRLWQQTQQGLLAQATHQESSLAKPFHKLNHLLMSLTHIKCFAVINFILSSFYSKELIIQRDYSKWLNDWFWHFKSREILLLCFVGRKETPMMAVHISWEFLKVLRKGKHSFFYSANMGWGLTTCQALPETRKTVVTENVNSCCTQWLSVVLLSREHLAVSVDISDSHNWGMLIASSRGQGFCQTSTIPRTGPITKSYQPPCQ